MLVSIAGSAPVDSPTSIISTDKLGNMPVALTAADKGCPSLTIFRALPRAFRSRLLLIDSEAVSSACISGIPPTSRVLSTRANWPTWYMIQIRPSTGARSFNPSSFA